MRTRRAIRKIWLATAAPDDRIVQLVANEAAPVEPGAPEQPSTEPDAAIENPAAPSAREDFGPRYGSLVEYPTTANVAVELKPRGRQAVHGRPAKGERKRTDSNPPQRGSAEYDLAARPAMTIATALQSKRSRKTRSPASSTRSRPSPAFTCCAIATARCSTSARPNRCGRACASYFRDGGDGRFQVRFLMRRVRDFETLVARSEKEALILENNLIKQYKPRYNIRLKDDKSYLSAKVTNHAWPRIMVTRRIVKDGGRYFGPFGSADGLRETIDVIRKVFPLRTCSDTVFRNRARPVPRIPDQAMPRAVLPAGRSRRIRTPSARRRAAARGQEPRTAARFARADEGVTPSAWNSRKRRACATACARSRRPSSARPCCIIGAAIRMSSGFIARAALSRRSS